MKVIYFEHIEEDEGKIKHGIKVCQPCELSIDGVMAFVQSEIESMLDGHSDVKLLLTVGDMAEGEMEETGEFEGW